MVDILKLFLDSLYFSNLFYSLQKKEKKRILNIKQLQNIANEEKLQKEKEEQDKIAYKVQKELEEKEKMENEKQFQKELEEQEKMDNEEQQQRKYQIDSQQEFLVKKSQVLLEDIYFDQQVVLLFLEMSFFFLIICYEADRGKRKRRD